MARLLVVAPAWVGDAVLTHPLLQRLKAREPGCTLDVLAPPWTRAVFERMPEVAAVHDAPFAHGELAWGRRRALARDLAARGYTQALVLPNSFKSALVPWLAGIPRRTGYVGEARWWLLNDARRLDARALPLMVERFAALAEAPGAPVRALAPAALAVDDAARAGTLARLGLGLAQPVAVLCPGAEYGEAKRWPVDYFADLARRFAAAGWQVWIAGSPKDAAVGATIAAAAPGARDLCGRTSLGEAIDLLSCASHVVTNDSGLMHVAAALERPLTALYGSSSPAFTPPLSGHARILRTGIACSPCFERVCPLGHFKCLRELTPDTVWQAIGLAGGDAA